MKTLCLDNKGILEYQKNRFPYLMIDVAEEIVPGKSAKGFKNLSSNEWFFKCHFPGDPNMPGMLQLEAMSQTAALSILSLPKNKGKIVYIAKASDISFKQKVISGNKLYVSTKLILWKRGIGKAECKAYVDKKIVSSAKFDLVLNSELENFKVR